MLDKFLQEERDRIIRDTMRNQKIHNQFVEKATKKELYEKRKTSERFPNELNQRYSYRTK